MGGDFADDVNAFHDTVDTVNHLNDDVNAAEDGLNAISSATSDTASLLPDADNATEVELGNRTGCFVEYLGASWSSKSAELQSEEEVLEAETEDGHRVAKGTVMGLGYFAVGVLFLFFGCVPWPWHSILLLRRRCCSVKRSSADVGMYVRV